MSDRDRLAALSSKRAQLVPLEQPRADTDAVAATLRSQVAMTAAPGRRSVSAVIRLLRSIWRAAHSAVRSREARARRARGLAGEARVAAVLDRIGSAHRLRTWHAVPLRTRDGRRGDLDHALWRGRRPAFIIAVETKAERPAPHHLDQVTANAQRASLRHFRGVPQYRIVVHPNSREPIVYDARVGAVRMGLVHLAGYVEELVRGDHTARLMR